MIYDRRFVDFGTVPVETTTPGQPAPPAADPGELAATMVVRGAVGTLIGAATAPPGKEGVWGAIGFVVGATFGEIGIVGVAMAALYRKASS
jgi:hypothetical protein